ncbi:MAG: hypothetical protein QXS02_00530 [Candidatus Thermoplasmatota archaeon]
MNKKNNDITNAENKTRIIRVAILAEQPLFWQTCALRFFPSILDNYTWHKDDKTYTMRTTFIYDKDIRKGELKKSNYDLLLIPGGGVGDGHSITKGFTFLPHIKKWKKQIQEFIKAGGGCIGFCGGASLITNLSTGENRKPTTFVERQYNKSSLGISCITSYYKHLALPLFYPFQRAHPENIGTTAYVFSFYPTETKDGRFIHTGGVPIDFKLNKKHPVFNDHHKDTERIRWWGGQALIVPDKPDREIHILAWYPPKELHEQDSTRIHAWVYTGGLHGLIRAFFKSLSYLKKERLSLSNLFMCTYFFAGNWVITNRVIESALAGRPAITAEIYPNENKGRIVLCTAHPEYMVWWGGRIEEHRNKKFICLADGLYRWTDIEPLSQSLDDEITHTWWIVRRLIAWVAKVPDEHLPPIEKQILSDEIKKTISKNIIWNRTILNVMENI